jgi:glycosyltransferase involved in cell wall biosynthesis
VGFSPPLHPDGGLKPTLQLTDDLMRICFLSRRYFPTVSGMSVYADNIVRQMVALGHDVIMLSQYYGGEAAGVYGGGPPPGIDGATVIGVESVNEQARGDFEADIDLLVDHVVRLHESKPLDIVHAQYGYPTGFAALIAARRLGLPCVVSIQGGDGHWVGECCGTHKRAMQQVCDESDRLIIGSDSFAQEVHERLGTPLDRFTIIPGAVDTSRFHPPAQHEDRVTRLLYHGRVDRRKGALELLDAFEILRAEGRHLRLRMSGIGPDFPEVEARCKTIRGAEATGYADYFAAPDIYRDADVFVSPTHAEGFSNTILEAMATGLPIVSCRAVGVVDCLRHERDSLLANVGDVSDLVANLRRILDDHELRNGLAAAALKECRELYSWPAIAKRISGVYEQVRDADPKAFERRDLPIEPCKFREKPHLL